MAAADTLVIETRMKDFATAEFHRLSATIKSFGTSASTAIKGATGAIFSLKGILVQAAAVFGGMKLVDKVAELEETEIAFANLTKGIGGQVDALGELRSGFKNTIDDLTLMRLGNKTMITGVIVAKGQLKEMAELTETLSKSVGMDAVEAFDLFASALSKEGMGRQLRQLGIMFDQDEAILAYCAATGRAKDALGDLETRQVVATAAMEAARKQVELLGPEVFTLGDAWGQFKTALANTSLDVLRELTPLLKELFRALTDMVKENKPAVLGFFADVIDAGSLFGTAVIDIVAGIESAIGNLRSSWQSLKLLADPKDSFLAGLDVLASSGEIDKTAESLARLANVIHTQGAAAAERIRTLAKAKQDAFESDLNADWMPDSLDLVSESPKETIQTNKEYNAELKDRIALARELMKDKDKYNAEIVAKEQYDIQFDAAKGAQNAFRQMSIEAVKFGDMASQAIHGVEGAISGGLTDGIMSFVDGTKSASEAFSQMAKSILGDIARIMMNQLMTGLVKSAFGAIGGLFGGAASESMAFGGSVSPALGSGAGPVVFSAKGGLAPGHLIPLRGRMAMGGTTTGAGAYIVGEGFNDEAIVPLPDNRSIPVRFVGGSGGRGGRGAKIVNNISISYNAVTVSEERRLIQRNARLIADQVATRMNQSLGYREAMA